MRIKDAEKNTLTTQNLDDRSFAISIEFEGEMSPDGGMSFNRETGLFDLSREQAGRLRDELDKFLRA